MDQILERAAWLRKNTCLRVLEPDVVVAIATHLTPTTVQANRRLILEDTQPDTLYILKTGRLERYRTQRASMAQATTLVSGGVVHLQEILLQQPTDFTLITLEDCELWQLSASRLNKLPKTTLVCSRNSPKS